MKAKISIYDVISEVLKMKHCLAKALVYTGISMFMVTMLLYATAFASEPRGRQIVKEDFLTSSGGYLKNKSGNIVALRGVNAGGWLIQESWMCPINGEDRAWANLDTINAMKNRGFTDDQIQKLFDTYQNNWFTTIDLDNLKAMNVNLLRVPFWYRNFMKDENGTWITGTDLNSNPGIKRLDWVISECGKRGIYVILDLHGAPGGQSMDHSCGTLSKNELYDSSKNRKIMADLWSKIAARYKGNPIVAAYDIMNEPQNNERYSGANAWSPGSREALNRTYSVYDEMYKVIRAVDPDHVITIEAIWDRNCLPDPMKYGWNNLMYQMHVYDKSIDMIDKRVGDLKYYQSQYGVAAYAGEFNCDPNEEHVMSKFNEAGINWSTWAYKGSKQDTDNNWFLYCSQLPYADVAKDSYDTILSKWGEQLKTSNFNINTSVSEWIKNHINDPVPSNPIESGKIYKIVNKYSGKALDVTNWSTSDGGNVQQWSYTGGNNQLWKIELLSDGYYKITNMNSGKVLDADGPSTADGANIQQWTWVNGANQEWAIIAVNGYYQIKNKYSGKVLDVTAPSDKDGTNIQQWTFTGADNQLFSISLK